MNQTLFAVIIATGLTTAFAADQTVTGLIADRHVQDQPRHNAKGPKQDERARLHRGVCEDDGTKIRSCGWRQGLSN